MKQKQIIIAGAAALTIGCVALYIRKRRRELNSVGEIATRTIPFPRFLNVYNNLRVKPFRV
jgi:hypothetical protein